jgi:hypothetical protein
MKPNQIQTGELQGRPLDNLSLMFGALASGIVVALIAVEIATYAVGV